MRKSRCEDFIRIAFALVLCRISRCGLFFSKLEILSKKKDENYFPLQDEFPPNFYKITGATFKRLFSFMVSAYSY